MSQVERVRTLLDRGVRLTAAKAWQDHSIARLAARVKDLRDEGYPIITSIQVVTTKLGTEARIAVYTRGGA